MAGADAPNAADAPQAAATVVAASGAEVLVLSPMNGRLVPLADVPDPVFSSGVMGTGVGVEPTSGTVYAPVAGTVIVTMDSGHAYGIRTADGIEVLVHVGIDTVNLKGEGFSSKVSQGDTVAAGDVLAEVDLDAIKAAGYSTTTVLLITNSAAQSEVLPVDASQVSHQDTALVVTH